MNASNIPFPRARSPLACSQFAGDFRRCGVHLRAIAPSQGTGAIDGRRQRTHAPREHVAARCRQPHRQAGLQAPKLAGGHLGTPFQAPHRRQLPMTMKTLASSKRAKARPGADAEDR